MPPFNRGFLGDKMDYLIKKIYEDNSEIFEYFLNNIYSSYNDFITIDFINNIKKNNFLYFKNVIKRYLVVNFQDTYKNSIKESDSNLYLNKYMKEFNLNDHHTLKENMLYKMNLYHKFIFTIIKNAYNDRKLLVEDKGLIDNIKVDFGDSHNGGQTVAIVYFENIKWIYKPKNLKKDKLYFSCLKVINDNLNVKYREPKIILRDNYSWQSFIEHLPCKNEVMINNYYYSLGIQACLLFILNANDMHFENLIANGEYPVFIDLETLLQTDIDFSNSNLEHYPSNDNVLNTLLFDVSDNSSVMDHIGGFTNRKGMPIYDITMFNKDNDQISIVESSEIYTKSTPNIPLNAKKEPVEIYEKKEIFLEGFKNSYKTIQNNFHNFLNTLNKYENLETRIVLRPTTVYANYIEYFKQMENESDNEILDILYNSIPFYKKSKKIAEYEINSLKNFDIPYFKVGLKSKKLTSVDDNLYINEFFKKTPYEKLEQKLSHLHNEDLNRQLYLLKLSIDAYRELNDSKNNECPNKREVDTTIQHEIELIEKYLDTQDTVFNIELNIEGKTAVTPISYNLYFGLSGVSLLYLQYQKTANNYFYSSVFNGLYDSIYTMWKLDKSINYSIYHGRFSYFKYVYLLNNFFNFQIDINIELQKTLKDYISYIEDNKSYTIDYLGGLSGIISLLLDFYKSNDNHSYLKKDIIFLTKKLIENISIKNNEIVVKSDITNGSMKAGLAHGTSGIIFALAKYQTEFHDDKLSDIIERMISIENNELALIKNNAWCNGLSGIVLSRNIIQNYGISNELLNIVSLKSQLLNGFPIGVESVCHGSSGNSLILKTMNINKNNQHILSYEWTSGYLFPNENISFFMGISGQLFNLLTTSKDKDLIEKLLI